MVLKTEATTLELEDAMRATVGAPRFCVVIPQYALPTHLAVGLTAVLARTPRFAVR